jgi:hypothetical protein
MWLRQVEICAKVVEVAAYAAWLAERRCCQAILSTPSPVRS